VEEILTDILQIF